MVKALSILCDLLQQIFVANHTIFVKVQYSYTGMSLNSSPFTMLTMLQSHGMCLLQITNCYFNLPMSHLQCTLFFCAYFRMYNLTINEDGVSFGLVLLCSFSVMFRYRCYNDHLLISKHWWLGLLILCFLKHYVLSSSPSCSLVVKPYAHHTNDPGSNPRHGYNV